MEPFFLKPDMRHYLWGGRRLVTQMNKPDGADTVAESWELACHPKAATAIADGPLAGLRFGDFVLQYPQYVGRIFAHEMEFPVLVKLLDTKIANSIQVHPGDEYAMRTEGEKGKTEMWLIIDCEPEAYIYAGFSGTVTREEVQKRVESNTLEEVLDKIPTKPGDFFFIPAGTVHAIGDGILVAEIQQNSDLTYRLYDFDRRGPDGKPRQLHIEKALDVASLAPADLSAPGKRHIARSAGYCHERLAETHGFQTEMLTLDGTFSCTVGTNSFLCGLCTTGNAYIECGAWCRRASTGDCVFFPADSGQLHFNGQGTFVLVALA